MHCSSSISSAEVCKFNVLQDIQQDGKYELRLFDIKLQDLTGPTIEVKFTGESVVGFFLEKSVS